MPIFFARHPAGDAASPEREDAANAASGHLTLKRSNSRGSIFEARSRLDPRSRQRLDNEIIVLVVPFAARRVGMHCNPLHSRANTRHVDPRVDLTA